MRPIKSLPTKPNSVQEDTGDDTTLLGTSSIPTRPEEVNADHDDTQDNDETQLSGLQDLNLNFP
jgi:hypothetical protein